MNHTYTSALKGSAQYLELARVVAKARRDEPDRELREPYLIMQRGLGNLPTERSREYAAQFYELGGHSLGWEVVEIPEYDEKGEIINEQNLPREAFIRLIRGGAMLLFPQGTHRKPDDLNFPQSSNRFLRGVANNWPHINLVPVRVRPGKDKYETHISVGKAVTVGQLLNDFPVNPIGHFARERIGAL